MVGQPPVGLLEELLCTLLLDLTLLEDFALLLDFSLLERASELAGMLEDSGITLELDGGGGGAFVNLSPGVR